MKLLLWHLNKIISQFKVIDFVNLFLYLFCLFTFVLAITAYRQNNQILQDDMTAFNQQIQALSTSTIQTEKPEQLLMGNLVIEMSRYYSNSNLDIIHSNYDSKSKALSFELKGNIHDLLHATQQLNTFSNIKLSNYALTQDKVAEIPTYRFDWHVEEQTP